LQEGRWPFCSSTAACCSVIAAGLVAYGGGRRCPRHLYMRLPRDRQHLLEITVLTVAARRRYSPLDIHYVSPGMRRLRITKLSCHNGVKEPDMGRLGAFLEHGSIKAFALPYIFCLSLLPPLLQLARVRRLRGETHSVLIACFAKEYGIYLSRSLRISAFADRLRRVASFTLLLPALRHHHLSHALLVRYPLPSRELCSAACWRFGSFFLLLAFQHLAV